MSGSDDGRPHGDALSRPRRPDRRQVVNQGMSDPRGACRENWRPKLAFLTFDSRVEIVTGVNIQFCRIYSHVYFKTTDVNSYVRAQTPVIFGSSHRIHLPIFLTTTSS